MKIFVTTIIGSPAAECAHFGICQVDSLPEDQWVSFRPQHLRHAKALLSFSRETGMLCFEFPFAGMRAGTRKRFFPADGFRVDSPGHLPDYLAAALDTENQVIAPGLYPLVFSAEGVMLEIAVKEKLFVIASKFQLSLQ